jgi:TonB family protein
MRFLGATKLANLGRILTIAIITTGGASRTASNASAIIGKPACDVIVGSAIAMPDQRTYAVSFFSNNRASRDVPLDLYAEKNKYTVTFAAVAFSSFAHEPASAPAAEPGQEVGSGPYYHGAPRHFQFRSRTLFVALPQTDTLLRVVAEPAEGDTPSNAACTPQFADTFFYSKTKIGEAYSLDDDELRYQDDVVRYFHAGPTAISARMVGTASCSVPYRDAAAVKALTPAYPRMAAQQGAVGTALVRLELDARGAVGDATILRSSGNELLDGAALDAARKSIYRPEIFQCEQFPGTFVFHADFEIDQS